ncbi:amino acid adenylation domain-containing protein [Tolypothrix sp. PCC 7910]|uniref:amino acid adenylation domain-containing protein n=1 Tax=Tolypothrix sp. PCC 7910 TaxID=2099387 RepID=UPI00142799E0|nr:amino acid adenylation domain-containing protein [Tolypothrix sp. PCC 7910]QIR36238.1 amino acid adenylation domain-containing protein [Tolypothrix sp. PCC 7910]
MLSDHKNISIHQLVEFQVSQTPDAVAVIFQNEQLTYRELNQKANQLAYHLRTLGVKPETLVGVCIERSLEMVVALLGILKAGGAYIPLDPTYPPDRLAFIIEDTQIPILLTQEHLQTLVSQHQGHTVYINSDWQNIAQQPTDNPISEVRPNNLAYVIYTSGSTGIPKGVAIEHRNTIALIDWAREFFTPEQLKGVLASTSICFDLSVFELFVTLCCGGKVILAQDALELPNLPAALEVTLINTVPSAIAALLRMEGIPSSVKTINLAGEPLQNALVQQLYQLEHIQQVFNLYGPTEDTTYSTVALIQKGSTEIPSIGRPLPNTEIYLLEVPSRRKNDRLKPVPMGVAGELYISGSGLARGYLNRPDLTSEKFILYSLNQETEVRLYKTGDLAVYLPDGNLKFLGRIDHQIKIRGFRVELGELEATINQYPGIREAVVIPRDGEFGDKRLVAYIVPKTHNDLNLSTLIPQSDNQQLQKWETLWNTTYSNYSEDWAGWNDSFTGQPMLINEVSEWVDVTVERILSLRPQRVLEIGCGKGLLLFRIASHCIQYVGTDISAEAIHYIEQQLRNAQQDYSHVSVSEGVAHELEGLEFASFDTVILNSVIQYFPGVDYLSQVIEKIVKLIKPGGQIFIGDVRSLPLLETFHTAVQLSQAISSLSSHQLQQMIRTRMLHDKELVIHPDFFPALKQRIPRISHVQTLLKRGQSQNELIRFRSDVILHVDVNTYLDAEPLCWDWQKQELSIPFICKFLQEKQPKTLKIINVPNARVFLDVKAVELLAGENKPKTVGQLREALWQIHEQDRVHPEEFWNISQYLPYNVHINWSELHTPSTYDVVLHSQLTTTEQKAILVLPEKPLELKPLTSYANNPLQVNEKNNLVPQLRNYLKEKLPDYMVPSAFVVMESLPLTPNGKIDRRSLPEPKKERPFLSKAYVAPSTVLERQLAEIWSQILEIEQVGIYDNFFELGGHSLLIVQLLTQVEDALQVKIPLFYLLREPTIAGCIKSIDALQNLDSTKPIEEVTKVDLLAEAVLDPEILPEVPFVEPTNEAEHIFLTGATGFLGAFLLHELLQQTSANVYCLIRASNLEEGRYKIQTNLERYMLWSDELNSRIVPLLGDLSRPFLGLNHQTFIDLASKLDLIYHAGAFVNLVYPYNALRATNVLGTQEILRLASLSKVTPVHFISTIDVLKPLIFRNQTLIQEDERLVNGEGLTRAYTQTKWVAEQLIITAQSRGIPTCIYRPGMISGHSQTGANNTNDLMSRIIKGMIQLGSAPDLDQWVNLTPIDYASKAIVHLSRQKDSFGKAFHIVNPQPLSWKQLVNEISSFGYSIKLLPHEQWQAELLLLENSNENVLNPIKSLFTDKHYHNQMTYLETFLMTSQAFDYQNTANGLKGTSITCPPVDSKLLNAYILYFIQSSFLKTSINAPNYNNSLTCESLGTASKWDDYSRAYDPSTLTI